jgi:TPR repeat protein
MAANNGNKQAAELAATIMASDLLPDEDLSLAYLELGCWYHLGKNVPPNRERTATYLTLAEQQGVLDSFDLEELRDALDLPFVLDWKELFPNQLH